MKKLFGGKIFDILETEDGFLVVYQKGVTEDKVIVAYKAISIENGSVSPKTRFDYETLKYGEFHGEVNIEIGNFITCNCVKLENDRVFVVSPEGDAKIYDDVGNTEWEGTIRYKESGPSAVASVGHTLWASFAEKNALIRFNLRTMREELRIGGSHDSSFSSPSGLWIDPEMDKLMVCNRDAMNLLEVNLKTYTVVERAKFDEPINFYIKVGAKELVVLDSGLYLI